MKKVLFVSSEVYPLIKTGGLADVCGSLPPALLELGTDVRLIMPNYQAIKTTEEIYFKSTVQVNRMDVNILETRLPGTQIVVWLVDYPMFFDFPGNPYVDEKGDPWLNSAERFALLCRVAVEVSMNRGYLDWEPDIVHCNDWQTGLVPALLSLEYNRPSTVFTIHNMAYQGLFPASSAVSLNLPGQLWHPEGLEFHDHLSFIKGGLVYADYITTVSPTYALEIQTEEYGYGLEGLLAHRKESLGGIINGIDLEQWDSEHDQAIAQTYSETTLANKKLNKRALQERFGLPVNDDIPLLGLIGRLVEQKGIDLIIECLPDMVTMELQFVLLGSGDKGFEKQLKDFALLYPDKIVISIGYDEALAHLIEAGSDVFLMPSRFEPCGLNQMYSQRYGTIPIVRKTGGLADTVTDTLPGTLANDTASGIVFNEASPSALLEAIKRTLILYSLTNTWEKMQLNAMRKDFSWQRSAQEYITLYENL